ncbi:MAG: hypothetical protein NTW79_04535 [Candidatus Berkelbacteria bacterium]|nr:hypothetical protein [Candidatus Berkelbacteria bacterium]
MVYDVFSHDKENDMRKPTAPQIQKVVEELRKIGDIVLLEIAKSILDPLRPSPIKNLRDQMKEHGVLPKPRGKFARYLEEHSQEIYEKALEMAGITVGYINWRNISENILVRFVRPQWNLLEWMT